MAAGATYEPISTTTLGSAQASVTFSSIPGTYTDLIIVVSCLSSAADNLTIQYNGDTGTNYSDTVLWGSGSSAGSTRHSNTATPYLSWYAGENVTRLNQTTLQIQNYSNSTTYKTLLCRAGSDGGVDAIVSMWRNTAAITSIVLKQVGGSNFTSGSTFTLYGIASA